MNLERAIEILEYHQEWRRGKKEEFFYSTKELGVAIDLILKTIKKKNESNNN